VIEAWLRRVRDMHNSCIEKREGGTRRQDEDEDEKRREAARVVREEGFQEVVVSAVPPRYLRQRCLLA